MVACDVAISDKWSFWSVEFSGSCEMALVSFAQMFLHTECVLIFGPTLQDAVYHQ